jgi:hypothetical protein
MKNLGKTIDRIIKVEPALGEKLTPIKNKWKRYPSKAPTYWEELIKLLNTDSSLSNPKRSKIRDIITPRHQFKQNLYSFEEITPADKIVGVIPENLADVIRRYDRKSIEISKLNVEAGMTHNIDLMADVTRKEAILDINSKKIWVDLKDNFKLWDKLCNLSIKKNGCVLVLTEQAHMNPPSFLAPGVIKMDPSMLKQFFGYLGIDPPAGLIPDEGDDK